MAILIIDDDTELCELVTEYLEDEGLDVDSVHDGVAGVERCHADEPDLVILDVMLPGLGGFAVLAKIRETSKVPVIMLTARGEEVDRIVGLEMGADDYLPKPFNPRELVARIRAILRRTAGTEEPGGEQVSCASGEVDLTGAEFAVLETLARAAGTVVSRDDLSRRALDRRASAFDRSLDVHLSNLRRKLLHHEC
jgi:two-component system response regulator CpxR